MRAGVRTATARPSVAGPPQSSIGQPRARARERRFRRAAPASASALEHTFEHVSARGLASSRAGGILRLHTRHFTTRATPRAGRSASLRRRYGRAAAVIAVMHRIARGRGSVCVATRAIPVGHVHQMDVDAPLIGGHPQESLYTGSEWDAHVDLLIGPPANPATWAILYPTVSRGVNPLTEKFLGFDRAVRTEHYFALRPSVPSGPVADSPTAASPRRSRTAQPGRGVGPRPCGPSREIRRRCWPRACIGPGARAHGTGRVRAPSQIYPAPPAA